MAFWNKSNTPKEPTLTKQARELCEKLDNLEGENQRRAAATIRDIISGIQNLGSMPPEIIEGLWSLMLTIGRKAIMPGSKSDALFEEVKKGVTEKFKGLILEKVKSGPTIDVDATEAPKRIGES